MRGQWVMLAPERLFVPDAHALEVLKLVDGTRTIADIVDDLATRYEADRTLIATDVAALLQDLASRGAIRL